nr:KUP/HAK/KT family potassium transporter [Streptomyces sp. TLI_235]
MADHGSAARPPKNGRPVRTGGAGLALTIGALGVVFGDIGTSPIYTLQTVFNPDDPHPVPVSTENVYGVVSLVFWSVVVIVLVTYVLLAMRADVEHNHVRHDQVVVLSLKTEPVPRLPDDRRIAVDDLGYAEDGIIHVTARFGYMETPDVPGTLALLDPIATEGELRLDQATYLLSKIELRRGKEPTMAPWRKRLFIATSYITADAAEHFGLPGDRTVIMGSHIEV